MVKRCEDSILDAKKEREHARSKKDKAQAELAKAQDALCEHEWALAVTVYVAGIEALVAQACKEAVQEYKANFKDTDDYLYLMRDATEEYKASLKKVNPDFDTEYYDRLILEACEPPTPSLEDQVVFDQLDPIEIPRTAAGLFALGKEAVASTSQASMQPTEKPVDPPTYQDAAPATSQLANPATAQPTSPPASQEAAQFSILFSFSFLQFPLLGRTFVTIKTILGPGWLGPCFFPLFECLSLLLMNAL